MQTNFVFLSALLVSAVAGIAVPNPTLDLELISLADNCTQYCSVAAGCVCTVKPSDCTEEYLVQPQDTCNTIVDSLQSITASMLYYFNPDIGRSCFGLQAYVPICIATPWYTFVPPVQAAYGTVEGPDALPVPLYPGIISTCSKFEYVGPNTLVPTMLEENDITLEQFQAWNNNATSVWAYYWACVGA